MNKSEREFLEGELKSFIGAGISRMTHSGNAVYQHVVNISELKEVTGRVRMSGELIKECEQFFTNQGLQAVYDDAAESIEIELDLNRCRLTGRQSRDLTAAQDHWRDVYGD